MEYKINPRKRNYDNITLLKRVCYNCIYRNTDFGLKAFNFCSIHKHKTPIYGYCPEWAPNTTILNTKVLKLDLLED